MSEARMAGKVGLFVAGGLVLLGLLLLSFTKGLSLFTPSYELRLKAKTVGGLKARASVLMSGVPVGNVVGADVADDGKGVTIVLKIQKRYIIHADARFALEQFGFLGDQYVAIYPQDNKRAPLKSGDEVTCDEPFNLQSFVGSTDGLIHDVKLALTNLQEIIPRLGRTVLGVLAGVEQLLQTNRPAIEQTVSNLSVFSHRAIQFADGARQVVATNGPHLHAALRQFETVTGQVTNLLGELQTGGGVLGTLIADEQAKKEMDATLTHLAGLMANLEIASSNLNTLGLWRMLWKPKTPPAAKPAPAKPAPSSGGTNQHRP
jgi:ABC-type transporter Mla subunit MlaD